MVTEIYKALRSLLALPNQWPPVTRRAVVFLAIISLIFLVAANDNPRTQAATVQVSPSSMLTVSGSITPVLTQTLSVTATQTHKTNSDQTNGLIIGSVVLVLIILAGTFGTIRSRSMQ